MLFIEMTTLVSSTRSTLGVLDPKRERESLRPAALARQHFVKLCAAPKDDDPTSYWCDVKIGWLCGRRRRSRRLELLFPCRV